MLIKKNLNIKNFFSIFSSAEKIFIFAAMACVFFISCDYGIVRPSINSIFLATYGVELMPYAWIAAIPLNFLVIHYYNRYLLKWGCLKTFFAVCFIIISMNLLSAFYLTDIPLFPFIQCIWKDVYILLMFKQIWSLIHTTINTNKAKFLYGLFFGIGGIGSVAGSFIPGFLAVQLGSQKLFLFSLPVYFFIMLFYRIALRKSLMDSSKGAFAEIADSKIAKNGFALFRSSKVLVCILFIVIFMQMSVALIDFQFNHVLEKAIPILDPRTAYLGKLNGIINFVTFSFQFLGGFLFLHFLGIKKCHFLVPSILFINTFMLFVVPCFGMFSYSYASIKVLDYSIFSIAREMLYVPMQLDEKFRAKAIIDVFASRSARGIASFFILCIQALFPLSIFFIINSFSIVIFCMWFFILFLLFRKASVEQEEKSSLL